MDTLLLTILLAFAIFALALFVLAIGWLITGKQKFKGGMCGRVKDKNRNEECGKDTSCSICEEPGDKKEP